MKNEFANIESASQSAESNQKSTESSYKPQKSEPSSKRVVTPFSDNIESDSGMLKKLPTSESDETGYFKELIKGVMAEDFNKTGAWKNKFMSKDIVSNMREYWEKQTPEIILNSIGGETKAQLLQQIEKLHALEKEWQNNYLSLISCEDKIRDEEKQFKSKITEFISLYKRTLSRKRR